MGVLGETNVLVDTVSTVLGNLSNLRWFPGISADPVNGPTL